MTNRFAFSGASQGSWRVVSVMPVRGISLARSEFVDIRPLSEPALAAPAWTLVGAKSNVRYATRDEMGSLRARQEGLGRPQALCAALIPIKKSAAWWDLAQDDRRAIFEETSHHTAIGLDYLPAIARQLYHCRDLDQPFDFLTWFEYAPEDAGVFEELVRRLRSTTEWSYVEREVDVRLKRMS